MNLQNKKQIIVVDYDQDWVNQFIILKSRLESKLTDLIIEILHVGSTSIPGLSAKPIIDMVIVADISKFNEIKTRLNDLKYYHNGDQGVKGREAFKLPEDERKKFFPHHLYYCDPNARELVRYKAFLEYLRKNPNIMKQYGEIKKKGAEICDDDIVKYMDHKGPFVVKHLLLALKEANEIPAPKKSSCPSCGSQSYTFKFVIDYVGDGGKEDYHNLQCTTCKFSWKLTYVPEV